MLSQSSIPRVPVHVGPGADARLRHLGIPGPDPLLAALRDGASAARATTELHPRSYQGQRMWAETHASLVANLRPHGWISQEFMGGNLVAYAELGVALIVTAGSSATSYEDYLPQVRYERQEVVSGLVNGHADTLFRSRERPEWAIWFLLHHLSATGVQAELSKPTGISAQGWVANWDERIVLLDANSPTPDRKPRKAAGIEVPVSRRVA